MATKRFDDVAEKARALEAHGLSLSAFFRLAADEYIANHEW